MGIKTAALESAEVVGTDAWLRTNTSSMSVDELAQAVGEVTGHPERICGLHFFNPVLQPGARIETHRSHHRGCLRRGTA